MSVKAEIKESIRSFKRDAKKKLAEAADRYRNNIYQTDPQEIDKDFVLETRNKLGMTQEDFANEVFEISQGAVARWEKGGSAPSKENRLILIKTRAMWECLEKVVPDILGHLHESIRKIRETARVSTWTITLTKIAVIGGFISDSILGILANWVPGSESKKDATGDFASYESMRDWIINQFDDVPEQTKNIVKKKFDEKFKSDFKSAEDKVKKLQDEFS